MTEIAWTSGPGTTLRITSVPWERWKEESLEAIRQLEEGEATGREARINFEDPTQIQRILTPKRLELLRSVMEDPPESIRALADRLDRNVSDVHEDVTMLADHDIIHLETVGRAKRPTVPYGEIRIEVRLSPPEGEGGSTAEPEAALRER